MNDETKPAGDAQEAKAAEIRRRKALLEQAMGNARNAFAVLAKARHDDTTAIEEADAFLGLAHVALCDLVGEPPALALAPPAGPAATPPASETPATPEE